MRLLECLFSFLNLIFKIPLLTHTKKDEDIFPSSLATLKSPHHYSSGNLQYYSKRSFTSVLLYYCISVSLTIAFLHCNKQTLCFQNIPECNSVKFFDRNALPKMSLTGISLEVTGLSLTVVPPPASPLSLVWENWIWEGSS